MEAKTTPSHPRKNRKKETYQRYKVEVLSLKLRMDLSVFHVMSQVNEKDIIATPKFVTRTNIMQHKHHCNLELCGDSHANLFDLEKKLTDPNYICFLEKQVIFLKKKNKNQTEACSHQKRKPKSNKRETEN